MQADNPAAQPCTNIDKGPTHDWIRRADGTAYCTQCAVQLTPKQVADTSVSKKAGGGAAKA